MHARRARSIAIAVSLGVLVVLFYIVTLVKGPRRIDPALSERALNPEAQNQPRASRRDLLVAFMCGGVVATMVGAVVCGGAALFLVLPHHRLRRYHADRKTRAHANIGRTITVRFDSNVGAGLPWSFEPERRTIDVKLGEVVTVYYKVTNESARTTTAQAGYNVSPPTVGVYFDKINCFCFTEQTLKPGEKRDMAVVFYVDPKLAKDSEQNNLDTITLSYTFYPVRHPTPRRRG